jgi:hypothetical protein
MNLCQKYTAAGGAVPTAVIFMSCCMILEKLAEDETNG